MKSMITAAKTVEPAPANVCCMGQWTSLLMALTSAAALGIAVTTAPARSGPNCPPLVEMGVVDSCITYPFTDVAAYVPTEYIWMYPATLLPVLFVVALIALHYCCGSSNRLASHSALSFAVMAATVHSINYFIQLMVVQPSLLKGEVEDLSLFSQYNPHGIFIALENLGYLLMGIAFLWLAFLFTRRNVLDRTIRYLFLVGSVVVIGGLIVLAPLLRENLEYQYEVLSLTVDWLVLIVGGVLLFFCFRRQSSSALTS